MALQSQNLDVVHREQGGSGEKRMVGHEGAWVSGWLCDDITAIMQRLNNKSCILWGLQGNCFCVHNDWDHILAQRRGGRYKTVCMRHSQMYREKEDENWIAGWVMEGKRKRGMIRNFPKVKVPDSEQYLFEGHSHVVEMWYCSLIM